MKALVIAWNGVARLMREREALFWIFIGPLLFTVFFGLLMRPSSPRIFTVVLVNQDENEYLARALAAILERDKLRISQQSQLPAEGWALSIPKGAASAMARNEAVRLILHTSEDEEDNAERNLRFKIQRALLMVYLRVNPADTPLDIDKEAIANRLGRDDVIVITRKEIGAQRRQMTGGFQRSVPSYLVMFVFLNLLVSGAGLAEERASGQLRRLFVAPVAKRDIVLGKLLSRFATGWIQIVYMLLLGVFVFKIHWADHPVALFVFLTLFALASASLGLLLGTLFKDPDTCVTFGVWTAVLLAPLGGLWWPLEVVGPTMRKVAYFVPTGWAMEGVNSMLAFGAGFGEVMPFALAFLAVLVISLTLATRRLTSF